MNRLSPLPVKDSPTQLIVLSSMEAVRSKPRFRGERILDAIYRGFLYLNQWIKRGITEELNPFAQLGAVANTLFIISLISGILLLFWYSPSIHLAYQSLESVHQGSWLGQLMRSLHRYSSDGMMLFLLFHTLQVLGAGKFSGPRWLAWVSGVVLVGLIWLDGWLGYWLVWDQRAQLVALGSAKFLDVLPFFADPLSRSFLTNESINSLLFFLVFFIHMLIPLGIAIGLWIHIMRLNRSVFFTRRKLSLMILGALIGLSLIYPATSAEKADMLTIPQNITMDWFYLFPLLLTERLQAGMLWVIALLGFMVLGAIPWVMVRRRSQVARVLESRCNGCTQCYQDCPYNAITMMPRQEREAEYAVIDSSRCVGCGICVGSCDPAGVLYPLLQPLDVRKWVDHVTTSFDAPVYLAFVCAESAGGTLQVSAEGISPELPGFHVIPVPCAGWVHPLLIERALRKGAKGVLVVGCDVDPYCRKGVQWTAERLEGTRKPALRKNKIPSEAVQYVNFNRTERSAFLKAARQFIQNGKPVPLPKQSLWRRGFVAAVLVIGLGLLTWFPSDAPMLFSNVPQPQLVVSFKHPGQLVDSKPQSTAKDNELLPHMRGAATLQRVRVPVRLRVDIDGQVVLSQAYQPGGLFHDGISLAIEKLPLQPGTHHIRVAIGDSPDPQKWQYISEKTLTIASGNRRHVVLFDRVNGFRWF